jgi:hypothetical protein
MSAIATQTDPVALLFLNEARANVAENEGLVKSLEILSAATDSVQYKLETLEGVKLKFEFVRGMGYLVKDERQAAFETIQQLLTEVSPAYRRAFVDSISQRLASRLGPAMGSGP